VSSVSTSDKWKHFERLVTAIHKAADEGAEVRWDEKIDGRQFDVTIRFKRGLYEYLTVVECKDYATPVPVTEVDAFVTKSADVHANHAVIASSSGFQKGAREVAQRHNIRLINIADAATVDLSIFGAQWGADTNALHFKTVELEYEDGDRTRLPDEAHALHYYTNNIIIECGYKRENLSALINREANRFVDGEIDDYKEHVISCPPGSKVVAPDDGEIPIKMLTRVRVVAGMTKAKVITGPVAFDPYLLVPDIAVQDVATGRVEVFNPHNLGYGVDTKLTEGTFYETPQLAMFYYCDRIQGEQVTMFLVESYQHGVLIEAELLIPITNAHHYVEVFDPDVLKRLRRRLGRLKAKPNG
jgi:hypothetical protein